MSVKVLSWVWEQSRSSGTDRLVLLALADSSNHDGECWPSVATLAAKSRISESTTRRCLRSLELLGEVIVSGAAGRSNQYRISMADPSQSDRGTPVNLTPLTPVNLTGDPSQSDRGSQSDTPVNGDTPPQSTVTGDPCHSCDTRTVKNRKGTVYTSSGDEADQFEAFWSRYPKKVSKKAARQKWQKAIRKTDPQVIIDGLDRYLAKIEAAGTQREFIKDPDGWLNGERWNDDLESGPDPGWRDYGADEPPPEVVADPDAYRRWVNDQIRRKRVAQ